MIHDAVHWEKIPGADSRWINEGSMKAVRMKNRDTSLIRFQGLLFAINDECPHAGASLSRGSLNPSGAITCPLHGKKFDLISGRCSGEDFYRLKKYPVVENADGIFIKLRFD